MVLMIPIYLVVTSLCWSTRLANQNKVYFLSHLHADENVSTGEKLIDFEKSESRHIRKSLPPKKSTNSLVTEKLISVKVNPRNNVLSPLLHRIENQTATKALVKDAVLVPGIATIADKTILIEKKSLVPAEITASTLSHSHQRSSDQMKEKSLAEEAADISDQMEEKSLAEEAADISDQMKEKSLAEEDANTSDKVEEKSVAEEVADTSEKVEEKSVAGEVADTSEKVEEKSVAEEVTDTSEKVEEKSVAEEVADTSEKVEEKSLAEEVAATSEKVEEKSLAEVAAASDKVEEKSLADEVAVISDKVEEKSVAEEVADTSDKVEEKSVAEEVADTSDKVEEKSLAEEVADTSDKVEEKSVAEEVAAASDKVEEKSVAEEVAAASDKVEEKSLSEGALEISQLLSQFDGSEYPITDPVLVLEDDVSQWYAPNIISGEFLKVYSKPDDNYIILQRNRKDLGVFRFLHTKPYVILGLSVFMTFTIMRILNPYTFFKITRQIKNQLGECLLVEGYDEKDEQSEKKKVWEDDKKLKKAAEGMLCADPSTQKKLRECINAPPGDAFDISSMWVLLNLTISTITLTRHILKIPMHLLTSWEIYELFGLYFFNSSAFIKVIAQTQPIWYNCVLYYLPGGAPEDEFTDKSLYETNNDFQPTEEEIEGSTLLQEIEEEEPKADTMLTRRARIDEEKKKEEDERIQLEEQKNFCERRHGLRKNDKDERIICCCWNPVKQQSGQETLLYSLFVIPLSTEKLLDYDETFTTTSATVVSIVCLLLFVMVCVPWGATHVLPMSIIYFPFTLSVMLLLIAGNYIVVTLPFLKKQVEEDDLDKEGNKQYVDAKDENGDPIYETDDDGNKIMEEKDGQQVEKVKQVVKRRTVEKSRAIYYPWLTCKKERIRVTEDDENEDDDGSGGMGDKDKDDKENKETKEEDYDSDEADEADDQSEKKKIAQQKCKECCIGFVKGCFVPSRRKFRCQMIPAQGKFIHVRKMMVYGIMIFLFNACFNWGVLRYNGHGYFDAPRKDFFAPSRSIIMYLTHVMNSVHTCVEFVNMIF